MKALSLVEFMISVVIFSLLLGGAYMIMGVGDKSNIAEMGYLDLQQGARQAMFSMIRELRGADSVVVGGGGSTVTFNTAADTNIQYSRNASNQVLRTSALVANRYLGNNINSLSFTLSGNLVEIQLTAQKTVRNRTLCFPTPCSTPAKVLKEKVRLRNE
ncbi:MAG: hypothetical protein NTZ92_05955 [Candidatus Omnitrophica bacterium]|nr:hypothetical protein [Candidatus Omnitrophota bacterium]